MAMKRRLWAPVQVNWDILENSLLNKGFSEYQPLSSGTNLISVSRFWNSAISQVILNTIGDMLRPPKKQCSTKSTGLDFWYVVMMTLTC